MKKVHYALGALMAMPALGMVAPAAHAATAAPQTPQKAAKAVILGHRASPDANCAALYSNTSTANALHGRIYYGNNRCLRAQSAYITKELNGLAERIRFYGAGGAAIGQSFDSYGTQGGGRTTFSTVPDMGGVYQVCQAIVLKSNHNVVEDGPVCENT
jgi:hypothetical protein